ncbi:MAG TPA: urea carboxylase-associated family protein [Actinomycetota bacterium]
MSTADLPATMRRHPVPGAVVREWVIPAKGYDAFMVSARDVVRFVDVEGKQVPDVICYDPSDPTDELSMGNSLLLNKRRELRRGDVLYSVTCHKMMTIVGYSNEESFAYGPMCSEEVNQLRYRVPGTANCRDNFAMALAAAGMSVDRRRIPDAFVPFMRVEVDEDGTLEIREPTSEPGDHYDLRAEMNLLLAVSNCPQKRNACNGFNPTPMGVIVYRPDAAAPEPPGAGRGIRTDSSAGLPRR